MPSTNGSIEIWNRVLKTSLRLPGSMIDRDAFLKEQLGSKCERKQIEAALKSTPARAGMPKDLIQELSNSCISRHATQVAALSFATGLPGGWWLAATVPADLAQFYLSAIQLSQKLAYLHGWPNLVDEETSIDDETLLRLTMFIGVMLGSQEAGKAIAKVAGKFSQQVVKRLPQKALTKYGVYSITKQVGKWIGVSVTKETFAETIGKVIPVVGGLVSGGISFAAMNKMGERLREHLASLPLAQDSRPNLMRLWGRIRELFVKSA